MQKENKIEIKIDEKHLSGEYVNFANIIFNDNEFVLDFARLIPNITVAEVKSRVIMTPKNIKILASVIQRTVKDYENKYGEIKGIVKDEKNIGFKADGNS